MKLGFDVALVFQFEDEVPNLEIFGYLEKLFYRFLRDISQIFFVVVKDKVAGDLQELRIGGLELKEIGFEEVRIIKCV
jgi:hypothetical protein